MAEQKQKTVYVVFERSTDNTYRDLWRIEAHSASAAIRQVAETIELHDGFPLRLAATPERSWTVMEISTETKPKYVLTPFAGTAVPESQLALAPEVA